MGWYYKLCVRAWPGVKIICHAWVSVRAKFFSCSFRSRRKRNTMENLWLSRQHSSRMRTARLLIANCTCFGDHHRMSVPWWGRGIGPQVDTFEQVCSDDYKMSVAGGGGWSPGLISREGGRSPGLMSSGRG